MLAFGTDEQVHERLQVLRGAMIRTHREQAAARVIQRNFAHHTARRNADQSNARQMQRNLGIAGRSFLGRNNAVDVEARLRVATAWEKLCGKGFQRGQAMHTLLLSAHYGKQKFNSKAIGMILILSSLTNALALGLYGGSYLGPVRFYRGACVLNRDPEIGRLPLHLPRPIAVTSVSSIAMARLPLTLPSLRYRCRCRRMDIL